MESPFGDFSTEDTNSFVNPLTSDMWIESLEGSTFSASVEDVLEIDNPFIIQHKLINPNIIRGVSVNVYQPPDMAVKLKREEVIGVIEIDEHTRQKFLTRLRDSAEKLRNELLLEIAPMALSLEMAVEETLESLDLMLPEAQTSVNLAKLTTIYRKGLELKCLDLVTNHLGLEHWKDKLASHLDGKEK